MNTPKEATLCPHDFLERESTLMDGYCALCAAKEIDRLKDRNKYLEDQILAVSKDGPQILDAYDKFCDRHGAQLAEIVTEKDRLTKRVGELELALNEYVKAQGKMRDDWAEGDDITKKSLWKNLHACEQKARELLAL